MALDLFEEKTYNGIICLLTLRESDQIESLSKGSFLSRLRLLNGEGVASSRHDKSISLAIDQEEETTAR